MKKFSAIITIFFFWIVFLGEAPLSWGEDVLTSEEKLACESILCLSSIVRPNECNPALNYFFSIKKHKLSDTIKARKNFLKKCPDSDSDENMVSLINVLVDYNCSACTVEKLNARSVEVRLITRLSNRMGSTSTYTTIQAVDPEMPTYCKKYYAAISGHEYTAYSTYSESQPMYVSYNLGQRREDYDGTEYYSINVRLMNWEERMKVKSKIQNNHWEWLE